MRTKHLAASGVTGFLLALMPLLDALRVFGAPRQFRAF